MTEPSAVFEVLAEAIAERLAVELPRTGDPDWWRNYVLLVLPPPQIRALASVPTGRLDMLDAGTLLRVLDRTWGELPSAPLAEGAGPEASLYLRDAWAREQRAGRDPGDADDCRALVRSARTLLAALGVDERHASRLDTDDEPPKREPSGGQTTSLTLTAGSTGSVGGDWLVTTAPAAPTIASAVADTTYVGIDFGTSTSVASIVRIAADGRLVSDTLSIRQPDEYGGNIEAPLVNTVLAWKNERLLFGVDAHRLRQELFEGKSIFSSFKMRLGIDLGPTWPETELRRNGPGPVVETARQAATIFFRLMRDGIRNALAQHGRPDRLRFAVTVPASFEANQRRDLLACMQESGLEVTESCLIDEPNAAFLSHVRAAALGGGDDWLVALMRERPVQVLVYDFGAGTCDVSILAVANERGHVRSRNLAISRFTALGGDDIDRAIAREILLPALLASCPEFEPEIRDVEERLLPRLQPAAERLKLAAVGWLAARGLTTTEQLASQSGPPFTDHPIPPFKIRSKLLSLGNPRLTLAEFARVLEPFTGPHRPGRTPMHVFGPVADALGKCGLAPEALDAVLFIGGSAANPIVRQAVMRQLPASVRAIVPSDLRTHVSLGAALHAFGFHHLGHDMIRPITPEPVFIIVKGGQLERIVPASSEVPSLRPFETTLLVPREGQRELELPVCVSNENKLLGLLRIEPPVKSGFRKGEEVRIRAGITRDKLLEIEVRVGTVAASTALLNPLANGELRREESLMLEAKQEFNEALLENSGRPPVEVVLRYAIAAQEAEAFEIAAEMFVAAERLMEGMDHASSICYSYSSAGRKDKAEQWARTAYQRKKSALTAYNLSCQLAGQERERLLRESLSLDRTFPPALMALGELAFFRDDPEGRELLEACLERDLADLEDGTITRHECHRLMRAGEVLGKRQVVIKAKARLHRLSATESPWDEDNLAATAAVDPLTARG